MAAFTSKADGNWSATGQTTWNEAGVPGVGDTVTITHNITCDADTTVGTSDVAGTVAIAVTGSGTLTVNAGKKLYVRGDLQLGGPTNGTVFLKMLDGSFYYFDGSVSNVGYQIIVGGKTAPNPAPKVWCVGTSGSHVTFDSLGTTKGFFKSYATEAPAFDCVFTDFKNISTSTSLFCLGNLSLYKQDGETGRKIKFNDCTFDYCGALRFVSASSTSYCDIQRNTWTNTISADTVGLALYGVNTAPNGNYVFKDNVVDKATNISRGQIFGEVSGNFFNEKCNVNLDTSPPVFTGNFVRNSQDTSNSFLVPSNSTVSDNYFFTTVDIAADPRVMQLSTNTTVTASGNIIESAGTTSTDGNTGAFVLLPGDATGSSSFTITNNIILPNAGGISSARPIAGLGGPATSIVFEHNTYFASLGGLRMGEGYGSGYSGHENEITSLKSNIAWGSGGIGAFKAQELSSSVTDLMYAASADYNCGYGLRAGTNLKGYDKFVFSSGSPGANDVDVDPQFVDSARNLAKFDVAMGGAGTIANAVAQFRARAAGYTVTNLLNYIRHGFMVQNPALIKGHDGAPIGAAGYFPKQPIIVQ